MKNTASYYYQEGESRTSIAQHVRELVQFKKQGDLKAFNQLFLDKLPEVKKFIERRLNQAIQRGRFPRGKYKAEDFIDQLFIDAYDRIEKFKNENDFYLWLFIKTNELLDDVISDEASENEFFQNIDDYSKPEWDKMVEKFSVEADGDFIMKEDLEDVSYQTTSHMLHHVLVEDQEKELIAKLDKKLSAEEMHKHIAMVLHQLPQSMQTVFELFTQQRFTLMEIAEIMKREVNDIEKLLKDARKSIYSSLSKRHSDT